MKYNNSKFYILNAVLFLAILISISLTPPDYSIGLRKFLQHEDSRNIDEILNSYSYPVKTYWNQKNVSRYDLEKSYKKAWEKVEYSRNYLLETKRLNNFNFILTTQFVYKLKNESYTSTVRSKLNVKLNNDGKIVSIDNIELLKSSGTDLLKNIENQENQENEEEQIFNALVRTYRYTLVFGFFIIVLNVWWFISYRDFETKRIEQGLIDQEKERLAKIEEEKQWLIKAIGIEKIYEEKEESIKALIERLKSLNFKENVSSIYKESESKRLIELIRKKYFDEQKKRFDKIEKDRIAKLEKDRLEAIERERLAKIEEEHQKEKRRLLKIQREKERKKLEKTRKEKEKREKERLEKERLEAEKLSKIKREHEEEKRRVLGNKGGVIKKSSSSDLSQYLGNIDEDILNHEKNQNNKNGDLGEYLTDFKK
ncbi:hypothetical protein GCM10023314_01530 [Algibacter agarivorans]|uniref:Uncharacterized protein n=1 Tax=Algibacter agarivorans TaxID=1109741 RepID=A0ABP9G8G1_9FLAO